MMSQQPQRKRFFNRTIPATSTTTTTTTTVTMGNDSSGSENSAIMGNASTASRPRSHHKHPLRPAFSAECNSVTGFGLPERSLSSSAALLRQRASFTPSSTSSASISPLPPSKGIWGSGASDQDGGLPHHHRHSSTDATVTSTNTEGSANYHLNINHYSSSNGNNSSSSSYRRNNGSWHSCGKPLMALVSFLWLFIMVVASHDANGRLTRSIQTRDTEIVMQREQVHQLEHKIQRMRSETTNLQSQVDQLEEDPINLSSLELQRKLFHLEHHQRLVEQAIQLDSRRQIQERFGAGPHYYVEMTIEFDAKSTAYDENHNVIETLLIETAHIDDMPHSVHLFLEQVDHGLYDTTTFHRNADHVLQAGPGGSNTGTEQQRNQYANFVEKYPSLVHVLFQEYSVDMPHHEYTLGYPGRPGGPDFYINLTQDNDIWHGPGGQDDNDASADPCFARIVQGKHIVDRMKLSQTKGADYWDDGMVHPVVITGMKIVSGDKYLQQQQQQQQQQL